MGHYQVILYCLKNTAPAVIVPIFSVDLIILREDFAAAYIRLEPRFIPQNNIRFILVYDNSEIRYFVPNAPAVDDQAC